MGDYYPKPSAEDMTDAASWAKFYGSRMRNPNGLPRTSYGSQGKSQYAVTTASLGNILQGTFNFRSSTEIYAAIDNALSRDLKLFIDNDLMSLTRFGKDLTEVEKIALANGESEPGSMGSVDFSNMAAGATATPEQIKYAGNKLLAHPNCRLQNLKSTFDQGFSLDGGDLPSATERAEVKRRVKIKNADATWGWVDPNIINLMWMICENGFVLFKDMGFINIRMTIPDGDRVSNHSYGAAIDIGSLGRESENIPYKVINADSYPVIRELNAFIKSLPAKFMPDEVGGPFENQPKPPFYTNSTHQNHLHLGYKPEHPGGLLQVLMPPGSADISGNSSNNGSGNGGGGAVKRV